MDENTALHTAARRFCQDRFAEWARTYDELVRKENRPGGGWKYSDEDYSVFPRYRIDQAIQVEVEKLTPNPHGSLVELRQRLVRACDTAEARLRKELTNPIAREALHEEAENCRAYIEMLGERELARIEALPFRRVLTEPESKRLWARLRKTWGIEAFLWFPLEPLAVPSTVIAFHTDYFERMQGAKILREALEARGISRAFQLHELRSWEPDYEIEAANLAPAYGTGGEQYSLSEETDWLAYASHESSITLAGEWLIRIFQRAWPEWSQRTYRGPFSTQDLRGRTDDWEPWK